MIRKSNIYSWLSMLAMLPMVLTACLEEDNYEQRYAGFNPNSSESYIIFEFVQDKNMEKSVKFSHSYPKTIQEYSQTNRQRSTSSRIPSSTCHFHA